MKKAIVLLSGGLDSATVLAFARCEGYECRAISFSYGQLHSTELQFASMIAYKNQTPWRVLELPVIEGSALTGSGDVPDAGTDGIPPTYVPARNTVFLAHALSLAESLEAQAIFIGVNARDYSGYPDCRPQFVDAFRALIGQATKATAEGSTITLEAPLLHLRKESIIRLGQKLGVDYSLTRSCYRLDAEGISCGRCDSCALRIEAFMRVGVKDPIPYA